MGGPVFTRVVLELERGEPISGRIGIANGPWQGFRGWLDLATQLEHLRAEPVVTTFEPRICSGDDR
jgi:hypothetical protein